MSDVKEDTAPSAVASPRDWCARDVMTSPAVAVSAGDPVRALFTQLQRSHVRHLVVVDEGRCIGVVDDRRIVVEWAISSGSGRARTAADLVPSRTRYVTPGTPVSELAEILIQDPRGAVPVLTPDRRVVGIVTARDLLRCLLDP